MTQKDRIRADALQYAGCKGAPDEKMLADYDRLYELAARSARFRIVERQAQIVLNPDGKTFEVPALNLSLSGNLAQDMLSDSAAVLVLGCTLGMAFEQQLNRLQVLSMADAVLFDAIGSAMLEDELDQWQKARRKQIFPMHMTDRFSCGYGDLPLALQSDIAKALNLSQTIGVYVQPSLMMVPSKSVTALIGLSDQVQPARITGCAVCEMAVSCPYRKEGKTCST